MRAPQLIYSYTFCIKTWLWKSVLWYLYFESNFNQKEKWTFLLGPMGAVNSECESHHRGAPLPPHAFLHNNFRPTLLLGSSSHHPHSLPLLFPKCRWIAVAKLVNPVVQRKCRSMVTHSKCLGCGRCSRIAKNQLWCCSVFRLLSWFAKTWFFPSYKST